MNDCEFIVSGLEGLIGFAFIFDAYDDLTWYVDDDYFFCGKGMNSILLDMRRCKMQQFCIESHDYLEKKWNDKKVLL